MPRRALLPLAILLATPVILPSCGAKSGLPVLAQCVSYSAGAELAPLDAFIAMDTSGSMEFTMANGVEKIDAVKTALGQFMLDPESSGIGATITFFPQVRQDVPEICGSDTDCKQSGGCLFVSTCTPSGNGFCHTASDCDAGDSCEPMGRCAGDPGTYCLLASGLGCVAGDPCLPVGICENRTLCDESEYAPALPVSQLPGAAYSILDALDAHPPDGGTPTRPALVATLNAARAHAKATPEHKVIVLLATDGLPTACDPDIDPVVVDPVAGIPKVVALAQSGYSDGIQTFVIGVFSPDEAADAEPNLTQIAAAGGSQAAFLISTQGNVAETFLQTLNEIRREAKACEFSIPHPGGQTLDATLMQVSLVAGNGASTPLLRVESATECDATTGGFYFDRDPFGPTPPGRVILCPTSCAQAESGSTKVGLTVDCDANRMVNE